jgi:DNA-binding NtrC family response regulator
MPTERIPTGEQEAVSTVIIVQDDFIEAERLRVLLEQAGYRVPGIAGRTVDAGRLAARAEAALAIVDMMLEVDVDGIHTATELARRYALKILITTGFPDAVIHAENVAGLACAVVKKPYTDAEILAAVARCLA